MHNKENLYSQCKTRSTFFWFIQ